MASDHSTSMPLGGLRIVAFEARLGAEFEHLIARHGATVIRAPALREERLDETPAALEFARRVQARQIGLVVLLTGVGTRALATAIEPRFGPLAPLLATTPIVARGPKPLAALRALGIDGAHGVAAPFTWRTTLEAVDALGLAKGTVVAVQEYGAPHPRLTAALRERGFEVLSVPVYRWELPLDRGPLESAAAQLAAGDADAAVFTSAVQVHHLMQVALDPAALRAGLARVVIASIGPACTEALVDHGIPPDLEADPPKLGPLAALLAARLREALARKRA